MMGILDVHTLGVTPIWRSITVQWLHWSEETEASVGQGFTIADGLPRDK
jgi:hypothetical protein